jgi:deoxyribonuclease-1
MGYELKISKIEKLVEPREEIKGTIARAFLYMSARYPIALSNSQRLLYQQWHYRYPPDDWEITWNALVNEVQGNTNP